MIRQIEKEHIPECVSVIRQSFATVADEFGFTPENAPRFTAFSVNEERLNWQYEEKRPMVAYFDSEEHICGFYSLELKENGECELNNLCVLPGCRHERIGMELLGDAFKRAKGFGCKKMNIGIVEENSVLRRWYEQYGFVHTGTKKFDFFPFTCGYMEKDLQQD